MYTLAISRPYYRIKYVSSFVRALQPATGGFTICSTNGKKQVPLFGPSFEKMLLMYSHKAQQLASRTSREKLGCFQEM